MKKQQGFTLIELMIVVAVIGVLSAIAIPQYQKYVAKAEGAAALATLTGLKTNVESYTVENGTFPINDKADDIGIPSAALGTITLVPKSDKGDGAITFAFNSTTSPLNQTYLLALNRSITGEWTCTGNVVDTSVLPKGCKTAPAP